jgi:thioredoxin 1
MNYSYVPQNKLDLSSQKIVEELTYNQFNQVVSSVDYITVINFYANWCLPCSNIAPFYEKMASLPQYKNAKFFRVNANINDDTIVQCNVCELPTFQFYYRGLKLGQVVGTDMKKVSSELLKYLQEYNLA